MNSFSVSSRINLGFGLQSTILVCVCIAAFGLVSLLGSTFKDYRSTAKQSLVIGDFVEDLYQARVGSFSYRLNPTDDTKSEVINKINEIKRDVQAYQVTQTDETTLARLADLAEQSDRYLNDFLLMSDALGQAIETNDQLLGAGLVVRQTLSDLRETAFDNQHLGLLEAQSTAQEALMLGRFYVEKFFVSEDQSHLTQAEEYFDNTVQILSQSRDELAREPSRFWHPDAMILVNSALSDLLDFQSMLSQLSASVVTFTELRDGSLNRIGPIMQDNLESWSDHVVATQDALGPRGQAIVTQAKFGTPIMGVVATLLAFLVAYAVGKWITVPLGRLAESTSALAGGNVDIDIRGAEHEHELGNMARALEVFRSAHIERIRIMKEREKDQAEQKGVVEALSNGLQALAAGHLDVRIEQSFGDEYEGLRQNFNKALSQLEQLIAGIVTASANIDASATSVSSASDDLSNRTENQAAALEETAAALDQLTTSVKSSAEGASEVAATMLETRSKAKESGAVVEGAVSAMVMIEESSKEISKITAVIADISFQTNLLALNAGIEAARAGEAGKGFAVVASEVRLLAQRSSEAASEVADLISKSTSHVFDGTKLINDAGKSLKFVIAKIDNVSQLISNIASNSTEQATGIHEINIGVNQLDQATQQNAGMVEASSQQGSELAVEAQTLQELVGVFRVSNQHGRLRKSQSMRNVVSISAKPMAR